MATTPSGKLIPPKMRKVALLGSRSVGPSPSLFHLSRPRRRKIAESLNKSIAIVLETGKSSLTVQFVDQHFVDSYYPTIENTFTKIVKHKGSEYQLDIIDTAGQVPTRHFSS